MTSLALPPVCGCDMIALNQRLLSYEQALAHIASDVIELERSEWVPLSLARGRTLSAPLFSPISLPPFDNAAMDGFAVRLNDIEEEGLASLPIAQRIAAGDTAQQRLKIGTCARIFTGAPLPLGADTVIAQEEVRHDGERANFSYRRQQSQNVRRQGENIRKRARLAEKGQRIDTAILTMAASVGLPELAVKTPVRAIIVHTGDEIIEPGQILKHGQIYNANGAMLRNMIEASGAIVEVSESCVDSRPMMSAMFAEMAKKYDLVVTTGGVSVGEEDHVLSAFKHAGGQLKFNGVAIKPGKPVAYGSIGDAYFLGLPGNPIACLVTWLLFGTAVIQRLMGGFSADTQRRVICTSDLGNRTGRREFRLATLGAQTKTGFETVAVSPRPGSADISQLMKADGLISLPTSKAAIRAGTPLEFIPIDV